MQPQYRREALHWPLDMIYTGKFSIHICRGQWLTRVQLSAEDKVIPARSKALIDTQISIALPDGTYGRVAPRSGLGTPRAFLL
jgi:hypothetical protein